MPALDSTPKPLQTIYGWYASDQLLVNRRYQRKLVWTLREKQQLVSSILRGYPVPAVLLVERGGEYEIIDGLQRLHTLMSFIENAFPDEDGRYFKVDEFARAKIRRDQGAFQTLDGAEEEDASQASSYLDYLLSISIMRDASESDVNEVFSRINTFGHRLSDQERRQAGVQTDFANMVRTLATEVRQDVSPEVLTLDAMPQISIDLPKMKHGYQVQADSVFWVQQGILRADGLRDSMDEQCIADILACIVGGQMIERSKDELDRIYTPQDGECERITKALDLYGDTKLMDEFKYCLQELLTAVNFSRGSKNLAEIVGVRNAFPSVFAIIIVAFHEVLIGAGNRVASYEGIRKTFEGLYSRLNTSRSSTVPDERRQNVNTIKGLMSDFVESADRDVDYSNASVVDIDAILRRSSIEVARYEIKQGTHSLAPGRKINSKVFNDVIETICAIANCGPGSDGYVLIGVANKDSDAKRISELDKVDARHVGDRWVVGVSREAQREGVTLEQYVGTWKNRIRNSGMTEPLKSDVLSNIDFNDYYGLGVLVIKVPRQRRLSFVNKQLFVREMDETKAERDPMQIAEVASRFTS